jgi:hypothetical protein
LENWEEYAQLVGDSFIKFYVCMHNKWNPYSKEVQDIPIVYWALMFQQLQLKDKYEWDNKILPHAELILQLTAPENYKIYYNEKERNKKINKEKDYYKEDASGIEGGGEATARYDPKRGLVDMQGNVIVPAEEFKELTGIDGVAISF